MDQAALQQEVFIPVAVDAERPVDGVPMVRATYFVVMTDAPMALWELELPQLAPLHGVGAVGIAGVVYSAIRQGAEAGEFDLFTNSDDVAAIFALEGEGLPLSVQLADLWIPEAWISSARVWDHPGSSGRGDTTLTRGDVYRVALPAFQQAYRYSAGDIPLDQLLDFDATGQVFVSRVETQALAAWSQNQIELARQAFPSKPVKLRYRGGPGA